MRVASAPFWTVSAALDALERQERRIALGRLIRAWRLARRSIVDGRALAAAVGIILGPRAARFIGGPLRDHVRRRRQERDGPEDDVARSTACLEWHLARRRA
jgi:hypothetical protein